MASMPAMGTLYHDITIIRVCSVGLGGIIGMAPVLGGGGMGNKHPVVGFVRVNHLSTSARVVYLPLAWGLKQ